MISFDALLRPAPIVVVVPPFHWVTRPAIGAHLLQATARAAQIEVQIIYANIAFAAGVGLSTYSTLSTVQYTTFLGERLFARAAYGVPPLGRDRGAHLRGQLDAMRRMYDEAGAPFALDLDVFERLEASVGPWVEQLALALAGGPRVVGCTTSFEQTAASFAILGALKRHAPEAIAILGGANCEGPMAHGLAALTDAVDHVFSGESEATFRGFVERLRDGEPLGPRVIEGRPCDRLDELPVPDYADYYTQLAAWLPDQLDTAQLPFETSRGCWWGEKHHCTFCGLNGQGMASREKSPDRALGELAQLLDAHPNRLVVATDNIMPHSYWRTVVPRLPDELPGLAMMYEQKANLTFDQLRALVRAGITEIQPGIEALSTGLLHLMAKGTTAAQNLALLRHAGALGMALHWNLLYGFPGDERAFYDETLALLPLLHHLPPPKVTTPIVIDRFSPYHGDPARFGIRDLRPMGSYDAVLPAHADPSAIAYHFEGAFETAADPAIARELQREVRAWRAAYHRARPQLAVTNDLVLVDTRHGRLRRPLTRAEAAIVLAPQRATPAALAAAAWALDAGAAVIRDGKIVPLATAEPDLLATFVRAPQLRALG